MFGPPLLLPSEFAIRELDVARDVNAGVRLDHRKAIKEYFPDAIIILADRTQFIQ